ncbi:MAG TPA: hypothetical protein VGH80_15455 [Xanthomonadaceae bacterium]|jgi:hypothetical protein
MSKGAWILVAALVSGSSFAADQQVLKEGLLNAARSERATLQLAKLCGLDPAAVASMEQIVGGDLDAMKKMLPPASKDIDAAAAEGQQNANRNFSQLGAGASDTATCKQAINFAKLTLTNK